jgi:hypothetical protein
MTPVRRTDARTGAATISTYPMSSTARTSPAA